MTEKKKGRRLSFADVTYTYICLNVLLLSIFWLFSPLLSTVVSNFFEICGVAMYQRRYAVAVAMYDAFA